MSGDDIGHDFAIKEIKRAHFPHEIGIIRGQLGEQVVDILAVPLGEHIIHVIFELREPLAADGVAQAADNQLFFLPQVDAVLALHKVDEAVKVSIADRHTQGTALPPLTAHDRGTQCRAS